MNILKTCFLFALALAFASCAKENNQQETFTVPDPVKTAFKTQNAKVTDAHWSKEGDHFAVEFKEDGLEKETVYDATGQIVFSEREIKTDALPDLVKAAITAKFADAKLLEADEITLKDGKVTYDIEIKQNGKVMELMFDSNGNFLGEEKDDDGDDDDDHHDDNDGHDHDGHDHGDHE